MRGALPASALEIGRLSDRLSFVYVEHAIIDRELNGVKIWRADGIASLPVAMLAALLLGPGTRITQGAVALLAGSGCSVAWTGEEGVRLYAGAVTASTSSGLLLRQAALASNQRSRLGVARAMYAMRFPGEDLAGLTMQQLRGREGARVRAAYREHARRAGIPWEGRRYDPADWAGSDIVNQCLSAANSALYGISHDALHNTVLFALSCWAFAHVGGAALLRDNQSLVILIYLITTCFAMMAEITFAALFIMTRGLDKTKILWSTTSH